VFVGSLRGEGKKNMSNLGGRQKKIILAFVIVTIVVLLAVALPNASARVKTIFTQTTLNLPSAFPAGNTVTFSGQVTPVGSSNPAVPVGSQVTIMCRSLGSHKLISLTTVSTTSGGNFAGTFTAPSTPGPYQIFAVFKGALSGGSNGNIWICSISCIKCVTVNQFVVPEYPLAGLAALFSCFGAFVVFKKRGSLATRIRMRN